jgi:hypothetical protein
MQLVAALPTVLAFAGALTFVADTAPPASCAARNASASARAFVAVAPAGAGRDTAMTATVCVTLGAKNTAKVGSYHGELHFDSTTVTAVRVIKAEGGMRVENAAQPGRVNFAGAAPTGFAEGALVKVVLRLKKAGVRPALRLEMKELNSTDGADLMKQLTAAAP